MQATINQELPSIEAQALTLGKIFSDDYRFEIPEYQRPYAWTTEQVAELLYDLLDALGEESLSADGSNDEIDNRPPYFLGSIVLMKNKNAMDVVDGQQRLVTLTMLFCALRELYGNSDRGNSTDQFIRQQGNVSLGTHDQFRLTLRQSDRGGRDDRCFFQNNIQERDALEAFLDSYQPSPYDSQQHRMFENVKYLRDELVQIDEQRRDTLERFIVRRCYLVVVKASDQSSAYRIFSVMNDRGLDLSPTDILKAEIIGKIDENFRSDYTDKWEHIEENIGRDNFRDLFAHIRMIYMKEKARGELSEEFRNGVLSHVGNNNFIDEVLTPFADAYEIVTRLDYTSAQDAKMVNKYLGHLRRLDNSDWIPPAMAFFNRNQNDTCRLIQFTRDLERLAYGMFIMRVNINGRINRYARVLQAIEGENDQELFEALALSTEDKNKILEILDGPIYSLPRVPRPLLLRLDSLLAIEGATYDYSTISIEHVLPQNPGPDSEWFTRFPDEEEREQWTHRLGNLVLLSRRKNSQAQNYDFERKKSEYFQQDGVSHFPLTTGVVNESEWTPQVLERRQKRLIDRLKSEWRLD